MKTHEIRKRDNSTHGHGEWAVVEFMANPFVGHWVEVFSGSWDACNAYVKAV